MGIDRVKEYLKIFNKDKDILEFDDSSATVELAAQCLNIEPARIAKSLTFKVNDGCILIVTAGDMKIDNKKFKDKFNCKAKMLTPDEVIEFTGYSIGGVCPFAITNENTKIYLDISLKRFDTIYPACGSSNSAIKLDNEELFKLSKAIEWVDLSK